MRDEASPAVHVPTERAAAVPEPSMPRLTVPRAVVPPAVVLRPSLALRVGASVALGLLLVGLVTTLVVPSVLGRPGAPAPLTAAVAVVVSIAAVVLLVGCWRVRLAAGGAEVTQVRLFSDACTIALADARRIEISTALADPAPGTAEPGSGSILPRIVVTGPADAVITSRENRHEADTLLPTLLAWSRWRPELVKDAHTLRFLTAYGRANP